MIVADGSHRELLCEGGLYAELWRKQSGGFEGHDVRKSALLVNAT